MKKVLCFGEILLRFSPVLQGKWIQDAFFSVFVGGAELNVASALSQWGLAVDFCSALPDNYLSHEIIDQLHSQNIDTECILFSGNRIGSYFLPEGGDLKSNGVIYDRAYSSFSELKPGNIDWDKVLDGIDWFHFSAINPALNENIAEVCLEALQVAKQKGITISIDLNYRSKLWQYGKYPVEVMPKLVEYCDVIMGNIWSANTLMGTPLEQDLLIVGNNECYLKHSEISSQEIMKHYPNAKIIANTFRMENEEGIEYFATLKNKSGFFSSKTFNAQVINKVGSGDCFMAGLIYGILNKNEPQEIINFSAAAAIGKMQEQGDATQQSINDIQKILSYGQ
jgi:2-dehydro-3-deoxygluconokinase